MLNDCSGAACCITSDACVSIVREFAPNKSKFVLKFIPEFVFRLNTEFVFKFIPEVVFKLNPNDTVCENIYIILKCKSDKMKQGKV